MHLYHSASTVAIVVILWCLPSPQSTSLQLLPFTHTLPSLSLFSPSVQSLFLAIFLLFLSFSSFYPLFSLLLPVLALGKIPPPDLA